MLVFSGDWCRYRVAWNAFLYLLLAFHIPVQISAIITIGFFIILTGALHEDGLADTADGLGGGADKNQELKR